MEQFDPNPKYYEVIDMEVFEIMEKLLTKEEFRGFIKGNILKYRLRIGNKEDQPIEKEMVKIKEYEKKLREIKQLPF